MRAVFAILLLFASTGCQLIPEIAHQPVVHNPFPQLTKVAIAPFFNLSAEPSVDGRQFAQAYFSELQLIRGFEVVPVGVVERAMHTYQLDLDNPDEVRKLATVLGVDAVVIGAVTDFTPYYPPRCAMQVEWYAANPCFQPIPAGYGLPWGTPEEEGIPGPLVLESEFALARRSCVPRRRHTRLPRCRCRRRLSYRHPTEVRRVILRKGQFPMVRCPADLCRVDHHRAVQCLALRQAGRACLSHPPPAN